MGAIKKSWRLYLSSFLVQIIGQGKRLADKSIVVVLSSLRVAGIAILFHCKTPAEACSDSASARPDSRSGVSRGN